MSKDESDTGVAQNFGGVWTTQKLKVLEEYLKGYTTALKNQPFRKAYIDAFAGTGYIGSKRKKHEPSEQLFVLENSENISEFKEFHEGSARMALKIFPRFDKYIYIDNDPTKCASLRQLQEEFKEHEIDVVESDANQKIQQLCSVKWPKHRAVMFLDPFGMQVDWDTVEAIAKTEGIDLWLFLPIGVGVNRLLTKNGVISDANRERLDRFFGTHEWFSEFYDVTRHPSLIGDDVVLVEKNTNPNKIGEFYNRRLKKIFAGVIEPPAILKNSKNSPIFQLFFAVGNQRGKGPALRIAEKCMEFLIR